MINANGGKFKTDKQAKYWLDQQSRGVVVLDSGSVYNNGWAVVAEFDGVGVVSITKILKNKNVVQYDRKNHDEYMSKHDAKMSQRAEHKQKAERLNLALAKRTRIEKIKTTLEQRIYKRVSSGDVGTDTQALCVRLGVINQAYMTVESAVQARIEDL